MFFEVLFCPLVARHPNKVCAIVPSDLILPDTQEHSAVGASGSPGPFEIHERSAEPCEEFGLRHDYFVLCGVG